jgi:hypothetical protein
MCDRDTITIKRLVISQGTAGGQIRSNTIAARGSLPTTNVKCRIQPLLPQEMREYEVKGEHLAWRLLFSSDPGLTVQDRCMWTEPDGTSIAARVTQRSRNADHQSRIWSAIVEEWTDQD